MKKMMITVAAAALMVAGFAGAAEAQHRGGGFHGGVRAGGFHGGGFHGGGFRGGVFFGGPLYDPFWYGPAFYYPYYDPAYYSPYPYYYPPYTDYGPESAGAAQGWYYCRDPQGYYPEVPSCRTQWQYVPPRP